MHSEQYNKYYSTGIGFVCLFVRIFDDRFEVLPTISADPHEGIGDSSQRNPPLSRSYSQPAIFPPKRSQIAKLKSVNKPEDDLDIINQIIETDETTLPPESAGQINDAHGRSLSLSHINNFSSLPILPSNDESIHHVLKANYFSAPDFSRLESPPSYESCLGVKQEHCSRPLTHGSRSSSMGDCQAACDRVDENINFSSFGNRRSSLHTSHSLSNSLGDIHEQPFEANPCDSYSVSQNHHASPCVHHLSSDDLNNISGESEFELPMKMGNGRLEAILSLRLDHHQHHGHNGRFPMSGTQDVTTPTGKLC